MSWSDEERRRNLQAIDQQVQEDIERFLMRYDVDQSPGFSEDDLADAVRYERFDRRSAQLALMRMKDEGRVHYLAGEWRAGPLPPEPGPIDQA